MRGNRYRLVYGTRAERDIGVCPRILCVNVRAVTQPLGILNHTRSKDPFLSTAQPGITQNAGHVLSGRFD
jgi:hypothetical protein